ncbi:hypothetical protein Vafri_3606 [Volvox africanus]|uniref:ShKT domain-containing protein n=2 Tax=Volvox africanus TaxID=51714 RepID=A0A8J4ATE7_9CHLO|nr:hypothetical protein Vafri_3606 [Volvox africanus]
MWWGLLCAILLAIQRSATAAPERQPVHVAFLTDCAMYSDWQSVGMAFSFRMSGQPGSVIRVMCCSEKDRKNYSKGLLTMVDTWVAPDMSRSPRNGDRYAAYNKPEAVIDWLDHKVARHEYVLVLDSDMILRRPFFVEDMQPKKGLAIGARYTYMIGVANELAVRHIPHVAPRNDTLAGPYGRRADQVGGFFFIHRDDLKAMSHDWLKFSEDVRMDDQAYRLSGDVYAVNPGDRPWISEMYGYAFGAANHDVWHKWDTFSMIYPGYEPREGIPKLMHYGLLFEVGKNFSFDKHWHYDFDVTKCPPWDLTDPKRRTEGIFPEPPRPSSLDKSDFLGFYRDLLAIETLATLNAAFCDYHISHCPPSEQLVTVCKEVFSLYNDAREYIKEAESHYDCQDFHPKCDEWTKQGECDQNVGYMMETCRKACGRCSPKKMYFPETTTKDLEEKLQKMAKELQPLSEDPDQQKGAVASSPKDRATPVVIPQHEQPVVVVPRNTQPMVQNLPLSPPPPPSPAPPVGSPPPPPSSPPSPPPSVSPSPSPSPPKVLSEKQLLVRCYRLTLPRTEVKDCVDAAKKGILYEAKQNAGAVTSMETATRTKSDLTSYPASEDVGQKDVTSSRRIMERDLEDLTLTQQNENKGAAPVLDAPVLGPSLHALLGRLNKWQGLLWLLIVLAFLAIMPRIARLRRRARSGMRTE